VTPRFDPSRARTVTVARRLRHADVDRVDQRYRDYRGKMHRRVPATMRPTHADRGVGHEHVGEDHVVGAGAAHPQRAPIRQENAHARGLHRHGDVQDGRAGLRVVVDRRRQEEVGRRRAAGEDLARVDPKAPSSCARSAQSGRSDATSFGANAAVMSFSSACPRRCLRFGPGASIPGSVTSLIDRTSTLLACDAGIEGHASWMRFRTCCAKCGSRARSI